MQVSGRMGSGSEESDSGARIRDKASGFVSKSPPGLTGIESLGTFEIFQDEGAY